MLLVLPPSETKRDGGTENALALELLSFPELTPQRRAALTALRTLSRNLKLATGALSLGPTQRFELTRNRELLTSPTLPAIERYTGVLYDGLDAATLTLAQRAFAARHVAIGSALFGLLRADDPIPAYRLSHDSRLPGLSLGRHWRAGVAAALDAETGLVLDLRSEAYASLGRAPVREGSLYLRVFSELPDGRRNALSHFNKKAKGEFTRAVLESGLDHLTVQSLLEWAAANRIRLEPGAEGELDLVV